MIPAYYFSARPVGDVLSISVKWKQQSSDSMKTYLLLFGGTGVDNRELQS